MNYVFCSVIWRDADAPPGFAASLITAAKLSENGKLLCSETFTAADDEDNTVIARTFADWCGSDYMLCLWDGSSAGRIKKLYAASGIRHPYNHMYHLVKVYDMSVRKCTDPERCRLMKAKLREKPFYYSKKSSAQAELRWMCGIFGYLDFSAVEKKPSVDFIEQPSNKYFVFRNGKCFHTKDCRIVQGAAVSSLRSYTYYSKAIDAGFTPCSRCKPVDTDAETAEEMRRINKEKLEEAKAGYTNGSVPKKKHRRKTMNVYRSLEHMCGMYGLGYRKCGQKVYAKGISGKWCFCPESKTIELFRCVGTKEKPTGMTFPDPYEAVREIIRRNNAKEKKNSDKK